MERQEKNANVIQTHKRDQVIPSRKGFSTKILYTLKFNT